MPTHGHFGSLYAVAASSFVAVTCLVVLLVIIGVVGGAIFMRARKSKSYSRLTHQETDLNIQVSGEKGATKMAPVSVIWNKNA